MNLTKPIIFSLVILFSVYITYDSIQHIRSEIYHRNGFLKSERGFPKMAVHDFKKTVELIPWETHYRLQLAKSLEKSAKTNIELYPKYIKEAIDQYKILIDLDALNPWFKARLGLIYHDLYKKSPKNIQFKELAQKYSKAATDTDNKNPLFTLHYGHLLYNYNLIDDAILYYKKTIEYDHEIIEAHFNLASIYNDQKNFLESTKYYITVCDLLTELEAKHRKKPKPEHKEKIDTFQNARIFLANKYLIENKIEDAYSLIIKIPVSVEKYELLAIYYEKTNQREQALSIYKQLKDRLKISKYDPKIKELSTKSK